MKFLVIFIKIIYRFRYAQCQLKELRRALNRNQLDHFLHTLPRDLHETYGRILSSIDEAYFDDVRRVLTLLCFSTRPLTVNELIDAHAVDLGAQPHLDREGRLLEQDDIIDMCLGLVEIVEDETQNGIPTARIAHFSVQEYLQSERILQQKGNRFAVRSAKANAEITRICLVYLLEPTLSNGILDTPKIGEFPLLRYYNYTTAKKKEFPLASYAAEHWYHHYINSQEDNLKIEELLKQLFWHDRNSFMAWVNLHNIDHFPVHASKMAEPSHNFGSSLYYAGLLGRLPILHVVIAEAAKSGSLSETVNAEGGWNGHALQAASLNGHQKAVQLLLEHGANANAQGGLYGNALQAASLNGHKIVAQLLLDHGADVNAQCGFFGNALQAATSEGHEKVIEILLDYGADVNAQYRPSGPYTYYGNSLQTASSNGNEKIVLMLLDHGADINAQGGDYGNALQAASFSGNEKIVQILLDHGADVNFPLQKLQEKV